MAPEENREDKNWGKTKKELIQHLQKYSVKKGDFVLKSGKKSNWFCDSKQTACRGDGILLIADLLLEVIPDETTAIGGLTSGADPIAFGVAAISAERGRYLKAFSIRKESKDYGVEGRLSGALDAADKAVIVEDTATRGLSALSAVEAAEEIGAEVLGAAAVVDRGGTIQKLMEDRGLKSFVLVTAFDLGFEYDT